MISLPKLRLLSRTNCVSTVLGSIRNTVWPANYQEPVLDGKQLEEIKEVDVDKFKELTYNPIKSLHPYQNNSLFFDPFLYKFESLMIVRGDRNQARQVLYDTMFHVKRLQLKKWYSATSEESRNQIELDPLVIFKQAFENCKPVLKTKMIKRGGAKYQVPHPITEAESIGQAIRWMRDTIRERPKPRKISFAEAFAKELLAAYQNEGKVIKLKNDIHKLCESNKAYIHYRWA